MSREDILRHAGAHIVDGVVRGFGDVAAELEAAHVGALLIDLSHRDRLAVAGPDAPGFLNRILSLDVLTLPVGAGGRPFLLDARGRIVGAFRLLRTGPDAYLFEASRGHGAAIIERLDHYHFGERIAVEPVSEAWALLTIQGPAAPRVLASLDLPAPDAPYGHASASLGGAPGRVARVDRGTGPGFDLWCAPEGFVPLWRGLIEAGARAGGVDALEIARIEAGRPDHPAELGDHATPLEVGAADGCSEGKGCYPGQEVIERTLAIGRPARALIAVTAPDPLVAGAPVRVDDAVAGTLTSAAALPDGRHVGLALVKRAFAQASTLVSQGVTLTQRPRTQETPP